LSLFSLAHRKFPPHAEVITYKGENTMKFKSWLLISLLLLFAAPLAAQSTAAAADSLAGAWTGEAGVGDSKRIPLTVSIKLDSHAAVSGTVTGPPRPGEIKTGSYDPKTGAFRFEVVVKEERAVSVYNFEGSLSNGIAIGHVNGNGLTGNFRLTKSANETTTAPEASANDTAAALRKKFSRVNEWVTKAAELVPADKYNFQPTKSVRTFGQLVAHVADSYQYYCASATGQKAQWSDAIEKGSVDKATLVRKLKETSNTCNAAYGADGQAGALIENIGHTNLHYGNMITYLRLLGMTPPSN